jgi:hypothetical protein
LCPRRRGHIPVTRRDFLRSQEGTHMPGEVASADQPIVFVIDDDASTRGSLSSLFRSVGLRAELFGSALELLQSKLPDVASCLVLDGNEVVGRFGEDGRNTRDSSGRSLAPHKPKYDFRFLLRGYLTG